MSEVMLNRIGRWGTLASILGPEIFRMKIAKVALRCHAVEPLQRFDRILKGTKAASVSKSPICWLTNT